jgi:hypothetical protein
MPARPRFTEPGSALATRLQLPGILVTIGQDDQLVKEEC